MKLKRSPLLGQDAIALAAIEAAREDVSGDVNEDGPLPGDPNHPLDYAAQLKRRKVEKRSEEERAHCERVAFDIAGHRELSQDVETILRERAAAFAAGEAKGYERGRAENRAMWRSIADKEIASFHDEHDKELEEQEARFAQALKEGNQRLQDERDALQAREPALRPAATLSALTTVIAAVSGLRPPGLSEDSCFGADVDCGHCDYCMGDDLL